MKKTTFFLLIFVFAYAKTYSQKEAYNWNFGIGAALTFNTSDIDPVFVPNSKLSNWEGCTTMSDENGNLLFYSNGSSIWNKENNIMDNGSGLLGNNSATHSCVSFKKPGSTNQYYIFTVDAVESNRYGFNYSIIDISQNGGLGKVIQKNIKVHPKPVEKLLVIPHSNQNDYWVIVHLWENNEYLAYLVDNNGVNSTPVVSRGTLLSPRITGHAIKASLDGLKIASAHSFAKVIELYDFDATTGKMTLTHNLQHEYFDWPYGVEFSPDKTRLYASLFSPCRLVQLDLTQNSENAIVNSMVELGYHKTATFYYGSLQLAPNGKMYVAKDGTSTLGVIKKPNELGNDCEYSDIGFNLLNGSKSGLGLPTFVQTFINPQIFCIAKGEELIPNGSFDNDFDGFYSQYYFIKNPPMNMNGAYTITNDPSAYFSGWMKFDDKSPSSNGKMFLADAGSNTKDVLIGTNVPVKKNTYYQFSCWVASVHNVVPPLIKVVINDQFQIAKQVPAKGGEWVNILFEWNSSNFDNAKVELFDDNPSLYGNDFVIDEISLKECFPEIPKFNISSNSPICEGDDLFLFADYIENAEYHWSGPDGFSSNLQNPVIKNAGINNTGLYYLYAVIDGVYSDTLELEIFIGNYNLSPDDDNLIFLGSAERVDSNIRLTNAKVKDIGGVWLKRKFSIKKDFITSFEFNITKGSNGIIKEGSIPGADGFAFVMQNQSNPFLGQLGGDIGYSGISNSVAVEFDLFQNPYDPNGNHLAVQSMGSEPNIPNHLIKSSVLGMNENIVTIKQDVLYYAKIEYDWANKELKVYLNTNSDLTNPALVVNSLDLTSKLNLKDDEYVFIGFTASTGDGYQEHHISNWMIPCKNLFVDDVENQDQTNISLLDVYPNPGRENIEIEINLPREERVNLVLTDLTGKVIQTIINNELVFTDTNRIQINTYELGAGMYFLRMQTQSLFEMRKVLIIK